MTHSLPSQHVTSPDHTISGQSFFDRTRLAARRLGRDLPDRDFLAVVALFVVPSAVIGPLIGFPVREAAWFWATYYVPTTFVTITAVITLVLWERLGRFSSLGARDGYPA